MSVEVSRPEKVLFPDAGITKHDLASYYERVAGYMLPHVRGRPVAMQRFPDGIDGHGFFHKEAPGHFPDWIERVTARKEGGQITHVLIEDADTLVYLADQAAITPHVWLSRAGELDRPDRLVFDLDPSVDDFAAVRAAARAMGGLLRELELEPFAMTTGSRGIQTVPLQRRDGFDAVRAFARDAARELARREPELVTVEHLKAKRGDRILIDVMRNGWGQHAVPPYAVRAKPGAPVAMPLAWDELGNSRLGPRRFTVRNAFRRLARTGDPWAEIERCARPLGAARKALDSLADQPSCSD